MLGHLPKGGSMAVNRMQVWGNRTTARVSGMLEGAMFVVNRHAVVLRDCVQAGIASRALSYDLSTITNIVSTAISATARTIGGSPDRSNHLKNSINHFMIRSSNGGKTRVTVKHFSGWLKEDSLYSGRRRRFRSRSAPASLKLWLVEGKTETTTVVGVVAPNIRWASR